MMGYGQAKKMPVTLALILLNTGIWLALELAGAAQDPALFLRFGALYDPLVWEKGELFRLFTACFLHFGPEHLGNNMLMLFAVGNLLEPRIGSLPFLLIYLAGGAGGNLAGLLWNLKTGQTVVSAGASGAVYALTGCLIGRNLQAGGSFLRIPPKRLAILALLLFCQGITTANVNHAAHLFGLFSGLACGLLLRLLPCPSGEKDR